MFLYIMSEPKEKLQVLVEDMTAKWESEMNNLREENETQKHEIQELKNILLLIEKVCKKKRLNKKEFVS